MKFTTRFAPSPTGPLHLGHAYSALLAHDMARRSGGVFLLRIEDIDQSRARAEWEQQIYEDLTWLGITWDGPVRRQSDNMQAYRRALQALWQRGLLYPCTCNRRDILEAASAPQEDAPVLGPDGVVYPGTCRHTPTDSEPEPPQNSALRLNLEKAATILPETVTFAETSMSGAAKGAQVTVVKSLQTTTGDVVLARRDMGTSYHLSVVVDDAIQRVTEVVRGADLFEATPLQVVLQQLLALPTPRYHHHKLIRDDAGKRLAKRDDARAISKYRADGATVEDIREMVGLRL